MNPPTKRNSEKPDWTWKSRLELWNKRGVLAELALYETTSTYSFHADSYYCWQQSRSHQELFHFHISFHILHLGRRMVDPFFWQDLHYLTLLVYEGSHKQMFPAMGQGMLSTAQSLLRGKEPPWGNTALLKLKTLQMLKEALRTIIRLSVKDVWALSFSGEEAPWKSAW